MQSRIPVSKPLALVVIGLIIGVSLGLGSGYAVFYPDMVNERSKTVEERISDIEDNVSALDSKLSLVNESINVIDKNLEGILVLTDVVDRISDRVSALENGQINLNSDLNTIEDELAQLKTDLNSLEGSWSDMTQSFSDLETAYNSVNNELEEIQTLVRENDGVRLFTTYMANPSSTFKEKIRNEVFSTLVLENEDFNDWVQLIGENSAKIQLLPEIDSLMGGLVWNKIDNTKIGSDSYQVKLGAYFPFEFSPAKVTVDKMHIEVKAIVDINTGSISGLQVTLVEIS
mgnify:FL=1